MNTQTNAKLQLAYQFVQHTHRNIFLTGRAGTGKTTFMKNLRQHSPKRMVVVAPTGVAAINAGGVTIHSFFQLSFGPQLPYDAQKGFSTNPSAPAEMKRFNREKINIIRSIDLLVIDEISMVRADILDGIDAVLRRFRDRQKPFGGLQLLMIGDLQQLAPIVKDDEWAILKSHYDTCYFFSSHALKQSSFVGIELDHIFRQNDPEFIHLLNKIRNNQPDEETLRKLNSRYMPSFQPSDKEGYITLTTHNYQSKQINDAKLNALGNKPVIYHARIEGEFPEYAYPTELHLTLKEGAQVMFVKNDPSADKLFYNGKIGRIVGVRSDSVDVLCPGEASPIPVEATEWENARYKLNDQTQEIEEEVIGKFIQLPLKLAWAITIHKSQGLTFDKAIIDARQSFAHGQVYVALSRCRTLEGMVLRTPISAHSIINDLTVTGFSNDVEQNQPGKEELNRSRKVYEEQLLGELFDFRSLVQLHHYVLKIWNEHSPSLLGNLGAELQRSLVFIEKELVPVSGNFLRQLKRLSESADVTGENPQLQERLRKAAAWFLEKMVDNIDKSHQSAGFRTDNRSVQKSLSEAYSRLDAALNVKRECMKHLAEKGFVVSSFLETRAKASIEQPAWKVTRQRVASASVHPEFFRILSGWRDCKADELGVDPMEVLTQKVMVGIADHLPDTAAALKSVKGMGGKKMQFFGREILEQVLLYRKEKGMEIPEQAEREITFAGLDSQSISLALFRQGLKLPEIARERGFAQATIEGHLSHFIARGELDVFALVDRKKYQAVEAVVKANPAITTAEIKSALDPLVSFGEIRMILADLGK